MNRAAPSRILIVDDHPLISHALASLIADENGMAVCAQASSALDAVRAFRSTRPHVVILDILLPDGHGLEVLSEMREIDETAKILVFSSVDPEIYAAKARELGAADFVHKSTGLEDLIPTIRAALAKSVP